MRPNLGRLSRFESLWEAWRDAIRVLIRVLQLHLYTLRAHRSATAPRVSGGTPLTRRALW